MGTRRNRQDQTRILRTGSNEFVGIVGSLIRGIHPCPGGWRKRAANVEVLIIQDRGTVIINNQDLVAGRQGIEAGSQGGVQVEDQGL